MSLPGRVPPLPQGCARPEQRRDRQNRQRGRRGRGGAGRSGGTQRDIVERNVIRRAAEIDRTGSPVETDADGNPGVVDAIMRCDRRQC